MRQQPLTHWSMPTHAASLSPYQFLSHTPLPPHSFQPSFPIWRSLILSVSPSPSPTPSLALFLALSLSVPHSAWRNLFLSRAHRSLSLYLPPDPTSPSRDGDSLSLRHSRSLTRSLSPRPFCGMARVLDSGGEPGDFDRSIEP